MMIKNLLKRPISSFISEPSLEIGIFNVVANSSAIALYSLPFVIQDYVGDIAPFSSFIFAVGGLSLFYLPFGVVLAFFGSFRGVFELLPMQRTRDISTRNSIHGILFNLLSLYLVVLWTTIINSLPGWVYSV